MLIATHDVEQARALGPRAVPQPPPGRVRPAGRGADARRARGDLRRRDRRAARRRARGRPARRTTTTTTLTLATRLRPRCRPVARARSCGARSLEVALLGRRRRRARLLDRASTTSPTAPSRWRTRCCPGSCSPRSPGCRCCSAAAVGLLVAALGDRARRRACRRSAATPRSRSSSPRCSGSARCSRSRPTRRRGCRRLLFGDVARRHRRRPRARGRRSRLVARRARGCCTRGCSSSASTAAARAALGVAPLRRRRSRCSLLVAASRCWSRSRALGNLLVVALLRRPGARRRALVARRMAPMMAARAAVAVLARARRPLPLLLRGHGGGRLDRRDARRAPTCWRPSAALAPRRAMSPARRVSPISGEAIRRRRTDDLARGRFPRGVAGRPQGAAGRGEGADARTRPAQRARRRLPMVRVDKPYVFDGPDGEVGLLDLFEGRPPAGRPSLHVDLRHRRRRHRAPSRGRLPELLGDRRRHRQPHPPARAQHDTGRGVRAPYANIAAFRERMGWTFPWYSSAGSDFNYDFHATLDDRVAPVFVQLPRRGRARAASATLVAGMRGDWPGMSAFLRDGDHRLPHLLDVRPWDRLSGSTSYYLDLTALGRQEAWEEPEGRAGAREAGGRPAPALPRRVRARRRRLTASGRALERRMSQRGSGRARRPSGVCMPSPYLAASPAPLSPPACLAGSLGLTAAQADASVCDRAPSGKTLVVRAQTASDRLALRLRAGAPDKLEVDVGDNGSADFRIARDRVKRIRVKAGGGDDQVRIDDANGPSDDHRDAHRRAGRPRHAARRPRR